MCKNPTIGTKTKQLLRLKNCPLMRGAQYMHWENLDDAALWELLKGRNSAAFEYIFNRHYKTMLAIAYTTVEDMSVAEDVVQDVFFKLWENARSVKHNGCLGGYLAQAVKYSGGQKMKRRNFQLKYLNTQYDKPTRVEDRTLENKELGLQIANAIEKIGVSSYRTAFILHYQENLSIKEIGTVTGRNEQVIRNSISRALKSLRSTLSKFS
jgi:RNA polymerase sigma-70 factor, ECF subfamily